MINKMPKLCFMNVKITIITSCAIAFKVLILRPHDVKTLS